MTHNFSGLAAALLAALLVLSGCGGDNDTSRKNEVTGTIDFDEAVAPEHLTRARVLLLDVSMADAASVTISELSISPVEEIPVRFAIPYSASSIDSRSRYAVYAEVFELGEGGEEVRAYLSTQSYPVLTHGYGASANLLVERVQ